VIRETQPIVALASDHAGVALKAALIPVVESCGYQTLDLGTHSTASVHYPEYGKALAESITSGQAVRGIAICGSGIGISIAANRHAGVRAALCHTGLSAELARAHNDANILALGARLIGEAEAKECVERFLTTEFEGGRHEIRIEQLG
jgi:ribose 5-phosphate isomerase B